MTHSVTRLSPPGNTALNRRRLLKAGALTMLAGLTPSLVLASPRGRPRREKRLDLYNANTGESLKTVYWAEGRYFSGELKEVNYLLRDHHSDEVTAIDTHLLDLLYAINQILDIRQTVNVISAYRSPTTNAMLRRYNAGIAKDSFHIHGKAVDIRIPGMDITVVRRVALALEYGGVGYYPRSHFVHIDTGPVRSWSY
jgi:uncharacterized protein YcbK (DUF882 family)